MTVLFAAACITMHLCLPADQPRRAWSLLLCRGWLRLPTRGRSFVRGRARARDRRARGDARQRAAHGPGLAFALRQDLRPHPHSARRTRPTRARARMPAPGLDAVRLKNELPTTEDRILFGEDGIVTRAGGYRVVAPQACRSSPPPSRGARHGAGRCRCATRPAVRLVPQRRRADRADGVNGKPGGRVPQRGAGPILGGRQYRLLPLFPSGCRPYMSGLAGAVRCWPWRSGLGRRCGAAACSAAFTRRSWRRCWPTRSSPARCRACSTAIKAGSSGSRTFAMLLMLLDWRRPAPRRLG